MNERQHLLRAVIDNPEDDSARLAYSDWLDEHADTEADRARAAFIRLQCAAARLDRYDLRRLDLDGQAEALLEAHGNTWLAGLKNLGINQHYSSFDRGFPEVAMVSVNDLLDRGDELWAVSTFRRLTLWEGWRGDSDESRFPAVAQYAHLARLRTLVLSRVPSSTEGFAALLASPHLTALDELGVFPPSDQPWLQAVLVSPLRERLTALSLGAYHPTAEVQALMDSGLLGRLRTLVFYGYQPWEVAAGPVLAAGATDRLNSLSWVMADLAGPALRELAASHPLKSLERLDFGNNNFTPDSLAALAEWLASDRLPRLTSLDLSYCRMREAEPAVLAACPGLARLRELDLTGCEIRNQGARALAASPHVAGLRILRLGSNGIQGPAARTLAESPYLGGLRVLELSGNRIPTSVEKVLHRRFGPGVVR